MNDKPMDIIEVLTELSTYWTVLVNGLIMVTISFVLIATIINMVYFICWFLNICWTYPKNRA